MTSEYAPQMPSVPPLAEGLSSRTFEPGVGGDGKPEATTAAFTRTVEYGFYEPWYSDEQLERLQPVFSEDAQELTGVYVDRGFAALEPWGSAFETIGFDSEHPVGTFVDYDKTLNAGGAEPLPARLITGVTVNPSFRRRGILKHMMTSRLAAAVEDGMALAALTVSEGGIYGRFGFGPATRLRGLQINASASGDSFASTAPKVGKVLTVDPSKTRDVLKDVFAQFHRSTRGSVDRQATYWETGTARWDPENITSWDRKARAAVHVREDGSIGGYVVFTFAGWDSEPATMRIRDLIAEDATSRLELLRHLVEMDLVERIVAPNGSPVSDPLDYALTNPRAVKTTSLADVLWLRLLNPVTALESRAWNADGEFSLTVSDSLGIASGVFTVSVSGGVAQVTSTDSATAPQHFELDVATLSSLYLGDVSVLTMRDAGRVAAQDEADWQAFSATFDLPTAPHCATHF
ncbi:GNAT family N-acetyltransferase [Nesterenkonia natronophila]|uniref:GNAT family N-acetyltransferase n=1 Tax=Nesterenkonia natronophila TaxID=2174932 RepID=A0A3A4EZL7_9MICC|nr:GNAT family N-acetyltransferase [Nesterenkonia natronophila]RJN31372.1 GNAT family N-acetyltransferase [Nesterenkonia natronophila]